MTSAAQFNRRVVFQARGADANGDLLGDWAEIASRRARITPLKLTNVKGAETVIDQRLQGDQPVLIVVRRDHLTRDIDNGARAYDGHQVERLMKLGASKPDAIAASAIWAISSAIWNQAENEMEFLAVQRRNGSDV